MAELAHRLLEGAGQPRSQHVEVTARKNAALRCGFRRGTDPERLLRNAGRIDEIVPVLTFRARS